MRLDGCGAPDAKTTGNLPIAQTRPPCGEWTRQGRLGSLLGALRVAVVRSSLPGNKRKPSNNNYDY